MIALLPACGCGDRQGCTGGSCPVSAQVEETKAVDTENSAVTAEPTVAPEVAATPAEAPVETKEG